MRKVVLAFLVLACCRISSGQEPLGVAVPAPRPSCVAVVAPNPFPVASWQLGEQMYHLLKAADHLEAAGMREEAGDIRRLAEKEKSTVLARIDALQAEVERLRRLVGEPQVLVHVKMVELSRTKLRKLGFDFSTPGHDSCEPRSGSLAGSQPFEFGIVDDGDPVLGIFEALRQDKLLRVLAEPTLVTVSGRPAYFHVGGEFPAPVPQGDGTVAIEYREYGTRVDLVPIVFGKGRIRLEFRTRVGEIDPSRTVEVEGQSCPGLNVREIDTGVELNAGQTLIIGGLVQSRAAEPVAEAAEESHASPAELADEKTGTAAEEIELLVLVRPEIVEAAGPKAFGGRPPRPAPSALPAVLEAKRPDVREAK